MTIVLDPELEKWLDQGNTLDDLELRLKEDAPKEIIEKFKKWKKERDEYEAEWKLP